MNPSGIFSRAACLSFLALALFNLLVSVIICSRKALDQSLDQSVHERQGWMILQIKWVIAPALLIVQISYVPS